MEEVIIAGGEGRVGVAVLRSLATKGIKVTVVSAERLGAALYSKFCFRTVISPSPLISIKEYIESLINLIKSTKNYKVLIPVTSIHLLPITMHLDILKRYIEIPIPQLEILDVALDKYKTLEFAKKIGIPTPSTILINSIEQLKEVSKDHDFPLVLKPRRSLYIDSDRVKVSGKVSIISKPGDIDHIKLLPIPYLLQEYIPGEGYGFFGLFNNQKIIAKFCHHRIHQVRTEGGVSSLRESVKDKLIEEMGKLLLEKLNWHGVAMVEFRKDYRDNQYKLMEINGRFWGSLQLSIVAGVDFPYLLFKMALEKKLEENYDYNEGILCRWLFPGEIYYLLDTLNIINRNKKILKNKKNVIKEILNFFRYFFVKNMYYDVFSLKDPLPFIFNSIRWILKLKNIR